MPWHSLTRLSSTSHSSRRVHLSYLQSIILQSSVYFTLLFAHQFSPEDTRCVASSATRSGYDSYTQPPTASATFRTLCVQEVSTTGSQCPLLARSWYLMKTPLTRMESQSIEAFVRGL